jgi:hypothetical protein
METMYAGDSQPPKILIEMPYLFDSSNYESYRTSYKEMYRTLYEEKGWAKTNLFLLDLSNAANLVIYYQSSDKIHPNI